MSFLGKSNYMIKNCLLMSNYSPLPPPSNCYAQNLFIYLKNNAGVVCCPRESHTSQNVISDLFIFQQELESAMSDLKTLFKNSSADGEDPDSRLDRGRDSEAYADRGGGMAAHLPPGPVKSMVSREINKNLFWKWKEKM